METYDLKDPTKRKFLGWAGATGLALLAAGCGGMKVLPTNVMAPEGIGTICTNEDLMEVPVVKIIGNEYIMDHSEAFKGYAKDLNKKKQIGWYYMMPLNKDNRILNGSEPSFGLISVLEGRRNTTEVGVPGGRTIITPSSKGDLYFPFTFTKMYDNEGNVNYNKTLEISKAEPIVLKTDIPINDLTKTLKQNGKKFDIAFLTENNFLFQDQVLKTKDNKGKVVEYAAYPDAEFATKKGYQPFLLLRPPFTISEDPKQADGRMRIIARAYGFTNKNLEGHLEALNEDSYAKARGFTNPLKKPEVTREDKSEKQRSQKQSFSIKVDESFDRR